MKDNYNPPTAEMLYLEKVDVLNASNAFETDGEYGDEFLD